MIILMPLWFKILPIVYADAADQFSGYTAIPDLRGAAVYSEAVNWKISLLIWCYSIINLVDMHITLHMLL